MGHFDSCSYFNTQFGNLSSRISDPTAAAQLASGEAYSHVSAAFINTLDSNAKAEVLSVYSDSLKLVWQVSVAFAGLGFILVWFEKEIKLRTEHETEFGVKDAQKAQVGELVDA